MKSTISSLYSLWLILIFKIQLCKWKEVVFANVVSLWKCLPYETGSYAFFMCYSHVRIHISAPECILFIWISFLKFVVNWRIIAFQYCVGFCHTMSWISHKVTYVPSLLNLSPTFHTIPPLWGITEPQFEFPESYSKFPLAIYFTYVNLYHFFFNLVLVVPFA